MRCVEKINSDKNLAEMWNIFCQNTDNIFSVRIGKDKHRTTLCENCGKTGSVKCTPGSCQPVASDCT